MKLMRFLKFSRPLANKKGRQDIVMVRVICINNKIEGECDFSEGIHYIGELQGEKLILAGNHGDLFIFENKGNQYFRIIY